MIMTNKKRTAPDDSHAGDKATPSPRLRLRLTNSSHVAAECARLYREGKAGVRDVGEVSKLSNTLAILGRLLQDSDLEKRLATLEASNHALD
jgi:hypothetical protein